MSVLRSVHSIGVHFIKAASQEFDQYNVPFLDLLYVLWSCPLYGVSTFYWDSTVKDHQT